MNRKEFIKTCGFATLGASIYMSGCASNTHLLTVKKTNNRLIISKKEFLIENSKNPYRQFIVVQHSDSKFPLCLYRINDNEYTALSMECTHNSCELQPQGTYLTCPCHGSEFNLQGEVQNPPAEKNLDKYTTTSDHENIYIQL